MIKGRVRQAGLVIQEICSDLEPLLNDIGFVDNAPFKTVSIVIKFGEKTDLIPDYESINKRYSELPVAVEMELAALRMASKDVIKSAFVKVTIDILIDVAKKYDLPYEPLRMLKSG